MSDTKRLIEQVDQLAEDRIARNAEIKRLRLAMTDLADALDDAANGLRIAKIRMESFHPRTTVGEINEWIHEALTARNRARLTAEKHRLESTLEEEA